MRGRPGLASGTEPAWVPGLCPLCEERAPSSPQPERTFSTTFAQALFKRNLMCFIAVSTVKSSVPASSLHPNHISLSANRIFKIQMKTDISMKAAL